MIAKNLTIHGRGANKLTVSGGDNVRVFEIAGTSPIVAGAATVAQAAVPQVAISGLTINHGYSQDVDPHTGYVDGVGILNGGTLTLKNDVVSDNVVNGGPCGETGGGEGRVVEAGEALGLAGVGAENHGESHDCLALSPLRSPPQSVRAPLP